MLFLTSGQVSREKAKPLDIPFRDILKINPIDSLGKKLIGIELLNKVLYFSMPNAVLLKEIISKLT